MTQILKVLVELLDEGVGTWKITNAMTLDNGFVRLLKADNYDPEDELWEFLPGAEVRLREVTMHDGKTGLLAVHPDPTAVKIWVDSEEEFAMPRRETHALPLGDGRYKVLATPHYTAQQLWQFPPGAVVRLEEHVYPGTDVTYLKAVAP